MPRPISQGILEDYAAIELFKQSEAHKLLVEPIKEELEGLKSAYDCKTVQEMYQLKGYYKGLRFILDIMERIERNGTDQRSKLAIQQKRAEEEIDSTDL